MSKIRFEGEMALFIRHPDATKPAGIRVELLKIPFQTFETNGSAAKQINLNSSDETQVVSGIEQAIGSKNITVYLRQGIGAPKDKLIGLAKSEQKEFTTHFAIKFYKGESYLRSIGVLTTASLTETPIPVGGTPALLKMNFAFKSVDAYRGVLDKKTASIYGVSELQFA